MAEGREKRVADVTVSRTTECWQDINVRNKLGFIVNYTLMQFLVTSNFTNKS